MDTTSVEIFNIILEAQNKASAEIRSLKKEIDSVKKTTNDANKSMKSTTDTMSS
jgi:hypothetical protein